MATRITDEEFNSRTCQIYSNAGSLEDIRRNELNAIIDRSVGVDIPLEKRQDVLEIAERWDAQREDRVVPVPSSPEEAEEIMLAIFDDLRRDLATVLTEEEVEGFFD